jgi:cytochrome c553
MLSLKEWAFCLLLLSVPMLAAAEPVATREVKQVLALEPREEHGLELFAKCAECHGPDGGGDTSGSIPRIAGQHYRVLVRQIVDFRRGKRWDFRMEGVATSHEILGKPQDIADVAWYVSRLDADSARGVGDGIYLQQGEKLYAEKCASCHGREGEGNGKTEIPRIAGQHAGYLARQIYDAVDGRRPELTRTHRKRFEPLGFEDVLGLTDYLARLGWSH